MFGFLATGGIDVDSLKGLRVAIRRARLPNGPVSILVVSDDSRTAYRFELNPVNGTVELTFEQIDRPKEAPR